MSPQDHDDPFNRETNEQVTTSCSWQATESYLPKAAVAPKWKLQTTEERKEQENAVKKLELKLQQLKKRPDNHYSYKRMPDASQSLLSSASESEDGDQDNFIQEEYQDEGLPLLWQQNKLQGTTKKTEDQYLHSWRFISCCLNC